jgi:HAE1 family hydrophobic/amphiphilic exporter-1
MERLYEKQIFEKVKKTKSFIGTIIALVFISLIMFLNLGSEFFPEERAGNLTARIQFPSSMPKKDISKELEIIESRIINQKIGLPTSVLGLDGDHVAKLTITRIPIDYELSSLRLQNIFLDVPDLIFTIDKKSLVSQKRPIQVEIYGDELDKLEIDTIKVLNILKTVPEIKNPTTDIKQKFPEIKVVFDRVRLSKSQSEISDYLTPLKSMLNSSSAGIVELNGESLPVNISKQEKYFSNESSIKYFGVWIKNKISYLEDVASLELLQSLPIVRHQEKKRIMLIEADLNDVDLAKAARAITRRLEREVQSKNIIWKLGGAEAERSELQGKMVFLVMISLLIIYVLMASQFENLIQPLIIMLAIPLCLIGTSVTLWLFGINVSAIVFVGLIILAGSCVGTSIILIDSINQNLSSGMKIMDAILLASKNRMRAVLLTQGTSIVGLLPLLFSTQEGAALQKSLSVTIIGGLTSSTILTMLLIPSIYYHMKMKELKKINVS